MNKTSLRGLLVLIVLTGSILACSLFAGGPRNPPTPTAVPEQPTENLEQAVQTATSATSTPGEIQIKLTDSQMTQYLAEQLKNQTDPILEDPQVHAHDGVIEVQGQVKRSVISGNVTVSLSPSVDDQGVPHLKVQSATLGPFPVPDSLLQNFSDMIDQSMNANAGPQQSGYDVKSIQVFDGYILITAVPK